MATITPLPTPVPSRQDPANFAARADSFLAALPTFGTEANAVAAEVNTNKNTAVTSATTATTQAGIATTAATTATTKAGIATTKATEALTSANNAAASFDAFDDRFLGSKSSNPSTDNDGNTLLVGAMYWNSTAKEMRVWNGSAWSQTFLPVAAYLQSASNLSDLANAATARTNLGLGTAATANVTTSTNDTTTGRLLKVGDSFNAATATALATARTINGVSFNGTANITVADATKLPLAGGTVSGTVTVNGAINGTAVTQSATDTTAGRLLKVGDFGLGGEAVEVTGSWNDLGGTSKLVRGSLSTTTDGPFVSSVWLQGLYTQTSGDNGTLIVSVLTGGEGVRAFVRVLAEGVWQPWVEVYNQRSILGTVSQSAGIPTGAIIERNNNLNGTYIRFADGTQICMAQFSGTSAVTTASGSSYVSVELGWTFPAAFASNYISFSGCVIGTGACTFRLGGSLTTTTAQGRLHSSVSGTFNNPMIMAIGRWF